MMFDVDGDKPTRFAPQFRSIRRLTRSSLMSHRPVLNRIAILGSGAMGSFVGGRICATGATVTLLDVNAAHIAAVNSMGLRLSSDEGEEIFRPSAMTPAELQQPQDLIIVLTKQPH